MDDALEKKRIYDAWILEHDYKRDLKGIDKTALQKKVNEKIRSGGYIIIRSAYAVPDLYGLLLVAKKLSLGKAPLIIYGDDDRLNEKTGEREEPHFKPDFSPDTFESFPYTGELLIVSEELLRTASPEFFKLLKKDMPFLILKTNEMYSLSKLLFFKVQRNEIYHIRTILSTVTRHKDLPEKLIKTVPPERSFIKPRRSAPLKVSIIIESRDNFKALKKCIDSIIDNTIYDGAYDITVVDSGSIENNKKQIEAYLKNKNARYIYEKTERNIPYLLNLGVKKSDGDILLFLSDSAYIGKAGWLRVMSLCADRHITGAVGAKEYISGGNMIKSAGVFLRGKEVSDYLYLYEDTRDFYFGRNKAPYNCLSVRADCMAITREKFSLVNGFSEELRTAYYDIDLCMKLYERGFYNVIRNDITIYCPEDDAENKDFEKEILIKNHERLFRKGDPFYNPNLSRERDDFSILVNGDFLISRKFSYKNEINGQERDFPVVIEDVRITDYSVFIRGYSYCNDDFLQEKANINLLLKFDAGSFYTVPALTEERKDIKKKIGSESSRLGFFASLPTESMLSDTVQLGVSFDLKEKDVDVGSVTVESIYSMTSKVITIPGSIKNIIIKDYINPDMALLKTDDFNLKLEEFSLAGRELTLSGYCFDKNDKDNKRFIYYILLSEKGNEDEEKDSFIITVKRKERRDISLKNPLKRNIIRSGFFVQATLPKEYKEKDLKAELLIEDTINHKFRKARFS